jgi:hypothetical protein
MTSIGGSLLRTRRPNPKADCTTSPHRQALLIQATVRYQDLNESNDDLAWESFVHYRIPEGEDQQRAAKGCAREVSQKRKRPFTESDEP